MRPVSNSAKSLYIQALFAAEDSLLREIDQLIVANDFPIHIAPEEGKLLQVLLKAIGAENIVEIGTLAGYSTIWLARSLPSHGTIHTIEHDPKRASLAKLAFTKYEQIQQIKLLEGKAKDLLPKLSGPFDAVFIDADKNNYNHYLDWAESNIRKNGLIIGDNTLLGGAVYQQSLLKMPKATTIKSMQEFNKRLADPRKYLSTLLDTTDGLTVAIKLF